jgi:hypothetical protein
MMFDRLIELHSLGMIDGQELVPRALALLDDDNADPILAPLSGAAASDLKEYLQKYSPCGDRISFGNLPVPTPRQVETARAWLKRTS